MRVKKFSKNTVCLLFLLVLVACIQHSYSFFFTSTVSSQNTFTAGEWISAETQVTLHRNSKEYSLVEAVVTQNSHHLVTISDVNQFLCVEYTLVSQETALGFDVPSVLISLGDTPLIQLANYSQEPQTTCLDLSNTQLAHKQYELTYTAQNSFDSQFIPTMTIAKVTTQKIPLSEGDTLQFKPSKEVSQLITSYSMQNGDSITWSTDVVEKTQNVYSVTVPADMLEFYFWSVDASGNIEPAKQLNFIYENSDITTGIDFNLYAEKESEVSLELEYVTQTTAPLFFEVKVSSSPVQTQDQWETAHQAIIQEHKKYHKTTLPTIFFLGRQTENLLLKNVPVGKQYFTVRLCSFNGACSKISESKQIYVE